MKGNPQITPITHISKAFGSQS